MRGERFRPGDDAVSPVVGVVLIVGIAVMLMTTVGVFVLGFGPGEPAPETQVQFTQEDGNVTVTMLEPAGVQADNLVVRADGADACVKDRNGWDTSGSVDQGDELTVYGASGSCGSGLTTDDTVRVVWRASNGGRSAIVGEYEFA